MTIAGMDPEKNERFTLYHDRCVNDTGSWDGYLENERMLWSLHEAFPPAGSVALGDDLLGKRVSHVDRPLDAAKFAKDLLQQAGPALDAVSPRDHWDEYYLGICHGSGRGFPQSYARAADHFERAAGLGNPFAEFEAIWSRYLAGGSRLIAIDKFRRCAGPLKNYARMSADALALMELGPVRHPGSAAHLFRVLELSTLKHRFLYHNQGSRQLRIELLKEAKLDVASLEALGTPMASLILFLLARDFAIAVSLPAPEMFRKSLHADNEGLAALCEWSKLDPDHLEMIVETAGKEGWEDSPACRAASRKLEEMKD